MINVHLRGGGGGPGATSPGRLHGWWIRCLAPLAAALAVVVAVSVVAAAALAAAVHLAVGNRQVRDNKMISPSFHTCRLWFDRPSRPRMPNWSP